MNRDTAERRVLLGVTGGIAAYRSVELARALEREGCAVDVVMTEAATLFVGPLTFRALVRGTVHAPGAPLDPFAHIELARSARAAVVAPATANTLTKLAAGFADNLLLTTLLAFDGPLVVCPAMNTRMWRSPAVREAVARLEARGALVVYPASGALACGEEGEGRMAPVEEIVAAVEGELGRARDLVGVRALVTAGPTREWIDDVRFVSNASSGRTGYEIARELARRGAEVALVTGPVALEPPAVAEVVRVESAREMRDACVARAAAADVVVMAAAVADFAPADRAPGKLKKEERGELHLVLERTPDILAELSAARRPGQLLVGFSLETADLEERSRAKLVAKGLDLVVANLASDALEREAASVTILDREGVVDRVEDRPKRVVARRVVDAIARALAGARGTR